MQIDWLTVGAQAVNFLILVALLKRFLYKPVLDAMARREARIAGQLHDAEHREAQADTRAREFERQSAELERQRQALLDQARGEADTERRTRLEKALADVDDQRKRWHAQLTQEWHDLQRSITIQLADAATRAARRALEDLADVDLEHAVVRTFARRLARLDESDRRAIAGEAGPVQVATSFDLDQALRQQLTASVHDQLGRDARFVRSDDLVAGIELRTPGCRVSWTIAEYLSGLEGRLAKTMADASPATAMER